MRKYKNEINELKLRHGFKNAKVETGGYGDMVLDTGGRTIGRTVAHRLVARDDTEIIAAWDWVHNGANIVDHVIVIDPQSAGDGQRPYGI